MLLLYSQVQCLLKAKETWEEGYYCLIKWKLLYWQGYRLLWKLCLWAHNYDDALAAFKNAQEILTDKQEDQYKAFSQFFRAAMSQKGKAYICSLFAFPWPSWQCFATTLLSWRSCEHVIGICCLRFLTSTKLERCVVDNSAQYQDWLTRRNFVKMSECSLTGRLSRVFASATMQITSFLT